MAAADRQEAGGFAAQMQRLLYRLVRSYELCDQRCLAQLGVTAAQAYTLLALPEAASLAMSELSQAMGLANSTMTRMVDNLVAKGLVLRRPDDEDRRVVRVGLTARGQEVRATIEQAERAFLQEVLAELPADERLGILRALEKLVRLMGRSLGNCCAGN